MLIKIVNNLDVNAPYSSLSNGEVAGVSSIRVQNINAFSASAAVQIGKTGEEQSEIQVLSAGTPSGTALALLSTTSYDHPVDVPVYFTKFDKIIVKRSTSGTAGTATALGTIPITPDGTVSVYDDTSGASTYAYRTQYYNSVTTETSEESDWITSTGYSFYSLAKIRQRILSKFFGSGFITDTTIIDDWINEWMERMTNVAIDVNKDYSLGTVDVTFGTSGLGTISSSDFKEVRRFWTTYNGTDFSQSTKMDLTGFQPQEIFTTYHPFHYFLGDNVFGVKPENSGGTARIAYYKLAPILVNDTDELPISMHGYSKSFVDYGLAQAYFLDEKEKKGQFFLSSAMEGLESFRSEITPRAKSGPQTITFVEDMYGSDWGQ